MRLDAQIRRLIGNLLDDSSYENYVGMDIRMRIDQDCPTIIIYHDEDHLPENTTDDDIARLKKKLELLEEIKRMQEVIEKFNEEHPHFVPVRYPEIVPWPCEPVKPWPCYPYFISHNDNTGAPLPFIYEFTCSSSSDLP
jgi:hypothetical protein